MSLTIRRLKLRGFRAFDKEVSFEFKDGINVLLGPVGSGKTSVIKAIEFALFGTVEEVRKKMLKRTDLVNDFSESAHVELELEGGGNRLFVKRVLNRRGREEVEVEYRGNAYYGSEAQKIIESVLGLGHEEFSRHVLLDYRALQDVVYGPPSTRSMAIDKLLGIELLEELFRSVPVQEVQRRLQNLRVTLSRVKGELEAIGDPTELKRELSELEQRRGELEKMLRKLKDELNRIRQEINSYKEKIEELNKIKSRMERLKGVIEYYLKKYGDDLDRAEQLFDAQLSRTVQLITQALERAYEVKAAQELEETDWESLERDEALAKLQRALELAERGRERMIEELHEMETEISYKRRELERLRREYLKYETYVEELRDLEAKLRLLEKKYGNRDVVEKKLRELKLKHSAMKEARRVAVCRTVLLKEMLKRGLKKCILCGRQLDDLKPLEAEYKAMLADAKQKEEELETLEHEIDELERVLKEMKELWSRIVDLEEYRVEAENARRKIEEGEEECERLEESLTEYRTRIRELMSTIRSARVQLKLLQRLLQAAKAAQEVEKGKAELTQLEKRLKELGFDEEHYERLRDREKELVVKITSTEKEIESLEDRIFSIRESLMQIEELKRKLEELEKRASSLQTLAEKLLKVKNSFREIQAELREELLKELRRKMSHAFKQMYTYADYTDIDIRVIRIVRGESGYQRSVYDLYAKRARDNSWVPVLPRLSDGQKALIALILAVTLHGMAKEPIGFLLLDEPVPNVDETLKKSLLKGMKRLGVKQVILATQSENIAEETGVNIIKLHTLG